MEAFGNETSQQVAGFAEIIRGIEKDCERSLLDRKNQLLFKQQLKENWLSRTKIIPPSFPKIQPNQASPTQGVLRPITSAENGSSNCPAREGCKTSHAAGRNLASCKRLRSNWKLQFRKDELNILRYKYSRGREEQGFELEATSKSFKVRRVFRRLEDGRQLHITNTRGLYEFSDEKLCNSRERLRTAELSPSHKQRFFA